IDDGAFDRTAGPHPYGDRFACPLAVLRRVVKVGAHHHRLRQMHIAANDTADTDDGMINLGLFDSAALADDAFNETRALQARTRKKARPRVDGCALAEQIDRWVRRRELDVGC